MEFQLSTPEKGIIDITSEIEERLEGNGVCIIQVPHTTAGLTVNEAESNLLEDLEDFLEENVPDKDYKHDKIDNNARAHLKTMLLSGSVTLPYENGKLDLGTWQSVLFVENDGPRTRKVKITKLN